MKRCGVAVAVAAIALSAGLSACGSAAPAGNKAPENCAKPQSAPAGFNDAALGPTGPAAVATFKRIAAACLVVDGKRLSNVTVALTIAATYYTETRTARSATDGVAVEPLTSPAWLRWGAAHTVLAALIEQAVEADHIQVPDKQVQDAVANCKRAAQQLHQVSQCVASSFRRDYATMAEEKRIKANGQSLQQWFADQLPKHTVYVNGYSVTVSQLVAASNLPPGCNDSMGC